jgi:hypothetical protein
MNRIRSVGLLPPRLNIPQISALFCSVYAQPSVRSIKLSTFPAERSVSGITGSWAMCWHFVVDLCKAARRMDLTQGFGVLESPQITFQKSNAVIG